MMPVGIRPALPFCSCTALGPFRWTSVPSRWAVSCSKKKAEVILLRRKIVEIALQLQLAGRNLFRLMLGLSGQVPRFHHHGAIALFGAEASWMISATLLFHCCTRIVRVQFPLAL